MAPDLQAKGTHPYRLRADGVGERCQIMDSNLQTSQNTDPASHPSLAGPDSSPRRKPACRKALPGIDAPLTAQDFLRVLRAVFPQLNSWRYAFPDPRLQETCRYTSVHSQTHINGSAPSCDGAC